MKIGICTPSIRYPEGGVGNYIRNLTRAIGEIDSLNDYIIYGNPQSFQEYALDAQRFDLLNRGALTRYRWLRMGWEHVIYPLECMIKRVDLIHAMMFVIPFLNVNKSIVMIYDMGFHLHPEFHQAAKVAYFKPMIERSARQADMILTISQHTKDEICGLLAVPDEKVRVTYLAHQDGFRILTNMDHVAHVRSRLRITKPYILFVGTIEPRKNIDCLLEAFAVLVSKSANSYQLVITGRRGWGCDIDAWIAERGLQEDVILTDIVTQDDLITLYNGCRVFVYPSLYEGFGIPILEAMACGAPVITSRDSSMAEVAGEAAVLVDPRSSEDLSTSIERLLIDDDLRQVYIRRGLERAKTFSWHNTAVETIKVYQEVHQHM